MLLRFFAGGARGAWGMGMRAVTTCSWVAVQLSRLEYSRSYIIYSWRDIIVCNGYGAVLPYQVSLLSNHCTVYVGRLTLRPGCGSRKYRNICEGPETLRNIAEA